MISSSRGGSPRRLKESIDWNEMEPKGKKIYLFGQRNGQGGWIVLILRKTMKEPLAAQPAFLHSSTIKRFLNCWLNSGRRKKRNQLFPSIHHSFNWMIEGRVDFSFFNSWSWRSARRVCEWRRKAKERLNEIKWNSIDLCWLSRNGGAPRPSGSAVKNHEEWMMIAELFSRGALSLSLFSGLMALAPLCAAAIHSISLKRNSIRCFAGSAVQLSFVF